MVVLAGHVTINSPLGEGRHADWLPQSGKICQLTSLSAMSSKYEVISSGRLAAIEDLSEWVEDVCRFPSSVASGSVEKRPQDEPAIATVSSSVNDSKLCAGSICGMLNKS